MNRYSHLLAALSFVALAAQAESADPSGQFAASVSTQAKRSDVQSELAAYKKAGVNPWSTSYNPLKSFQGSRSRADVTAEYVGSRDAVAAMTREDSGSAYLARRSGAPADARVAGRTVNAQ